MDDRGGTWKTVDELEPGDYVDLEGDRIADPDKTHPRFEFHYEVVAELEQETDDCIRVDFESGFSCGFPVYHIVYVQLR